MDRQDDYDPMRYIVSTGSVQPMVTRAGNKQVPMFTQHFGRAEYARELPILTDSLRRQGQAVCDALNSGEINEDEARRRLKQIYF